MINIVRYNPHKQKPFRLSTIFKHVKRARVRLECFGTNGLCKIPVKMFNLNLIMWTKIRQIQIVGISIKQMT